MRWIRSLGHAAAFQPGHLTEKKPPSKFRPSSAGPTPFPLVSRDLAAPHCTALPAACPLLPAPSTRSIALSSQLFSTIAAAERNIPEKSLPAKFSDRHLPGFILAPVYPGIIPLLANVVNPSATPTSSGPSRGPNSIACRGSRPSPKARKRSTNELAISLRKIWPVVTSADGVKKHPPPWSLVVLVTRRDK